MKLIICITFSMFVIVAFSNSKYLLIELENSGASNNYYEIPGGSDDRPYEAAWPIPGSYGRRRGSGSAYSERFQRIRQLSDNDETGDVPEEGRKPEENCLLRCCVSKNLPQKCLKQQMDSKTVTNHNASHVVVSLILTKECHQYHEIIEECKAECLDEEDCPDLFLQSTGGASSAEKEWLKNVLFGKYRLDLNKSRETNVYKKEGSNIYMYYLEKTWGISYGNNATAVLMMSDNCNYTSSPKSCNGVWFYGTMKGLIKDMELSVKCHDEPITSPPAPPTSEKPDAVYTPTTTEMDFVLDWCFPKGYDGCGESDTACCYPYTCEYISYTKQICK